MSDLTIHTNSAPPDQTCDGCGKHRRTLYVAAVNQWDGVVEAAICFFCMKKEQRGAAKAELRAHEEGWL